MAVFTPIDQADLDRLLLDYDLPAVASFEGIASGIENTNYFLTLKAIQAPQALVLTLFERLQADQLPFYLSLMAHLSAKGVACPAPVPTRQGLLFSFCKGKPAALVARLNGRDVSHPEPAHCALVGQALARAHLAVRDFAPQQPNLRGLDWWRETVPRILPHLDATQAALLTSELHAQEDFSQSATYSSLPKGAVHADLFRDNVLFDEDPATGQPRLGGFIDFYFAGVDSFLFDLAVVANDWALAFSSPSDITRLSAFEPTRLSALLNAYAAVRPFSTQERQAWPMALRAAAYRFWVSRLFDWHLPRPAQVLTPKDPQHFQTILMARRQTRPQELQLP